MLVEMPDSLPLLLSPLSTASFSGAFLIPYPVGDCFIEKSKQVFTILQFVEQVQLTKLVQLEQRGKKLGGKRAIGLTIKLHLPKS